MEFGWRDLAVKSTPVTGSYDERTVVFGFVCLPESDVVMRSVLHELRPIQTIKWLKTSAQTRAHRGSKGFKTKPK